MNVPELLQAAAPYRPWILVMTAFLFSCAFERTRKVGGALLVGTIFCMAIYYALKAIVPTPP